MLSPAEKALIFFLATVGTTPTLQAIIGTFAGIPDDDLKPEDVPKTLNDLISYGSVVNDDGKYGITQEWKEAADNFDG